MAYNAELQMLREICWLMLPDLKCFFCNQPLLDSVAGMTFGHRRHPKVHVKITVHHRDRNREHNERLNLHLTHRKCHERFDHDSITVEITPVLIQTHGRNSHSQGKKPIS